MVGAPLPTLESGERPDAPAALPNVCASTALISSELMCTSALGVGDAACPASGFAVSEGPLDVDCCVACSNSAIFWSYDRACSAMAAGACVCATGTGFFRTRIMATNDASNVAMLMMRSSLNFMTILARSAQARRAQCHGTGKARGGLDDRSHRPGIVPGLVWDHVLCGTGSEPALMEERPFQSLPWACRRAA